MGRLKTNPANYTRRKITALKRELQMWDGLENIIITVSCTIKIPQFSSPP